MNTEVLEKIGLTKTEIKIYLALLRIGQSTTTNIVRDAQIHASKVYEYIDRLILKGLVTYVIKSNKKYFSAAQPEHLKEFLREKKEKISEQEREIDLILPELKEMQKYIPKISSQVYEGLRGVKSFYGKVLESLKRGDTSYIIGAPRIGNEKVEGFLLEWHKKRIKKGIRCRYIYDSDAGDYGSVRAKMKYTKVKYLPKHISSPFWIEIANDLVGIGCIKGNNAVLFSIQDKDIAKGYLDHFNLIWSISKW